MDLVNFKVGSKLVALSILNILLTERYQSDLTSIPTDDPSFLGVKDYMGLPTPVFDLSIILNGQASDSDVNHLTTQLTEFSRQVKTIHSYLCSKPNQATITISSEQLALLQQLKQWSKQLNAEDLDLNNLLEKLQEPLHKLIEHFTETTNNTPSHRTISTMAQVTRIVEAAAEQVIHSYKPIIVYTTTDGQTPYIGLLVDSVGDSLNVEDQDIKSLAKVAETGFQLDTRTAKMLAGIVKSGDDYSLLLDPTEIFKPNDTLVAV